MNFEDLEEVKLTPISIFNGVEDNVPKDFDLEAWLLNTIKPLDESLKEKVLKYRETFDTDIKKSLPCCTISASFKERRSLDNIVVKNKLICLDIDRYTKSKKKKSNNFVDMLLVKEMFMEHPCTLYVGRSVSGDGMYVILRIYDEEALTEYFEYFRDSMQRLGLNIDESCKDYTRLRIYSYDPDAYFNPKAMYYRIPKKKEPTQAKAREYVSKNDHEKVVKIIEVLEQTGMDITQSYEDWVKVGAALYDGFGDSGEDYFQRISSFYSEYDPKITKQKWEQCRKMTKIKLSSFFYIANSYGVRY